MSEELAQFTQQRSVRLQQQAVVMEPLQAESHQLIQHNAKLQAQESTRVIGNPDQHPKKRAEQVV